MIEVATAILYKLIETGETSDYKVETVKTDFTVGKNKSLIMVFKNKLTNEFYAFDYWLADTKPQIIDLDVGVVECRPVNYFFRRSKVWYDEDTDVPFCVETLS